MAVPSLSTFYLGLVAHRPRHRPLKAQHQRDRRPAVSRRTTAARRRVLDLLHGHQHRRVLRAAHLRLSRTARQLALGFGAAGVGMTLGLIQYVLGRQSSRHAGLAPRAPAIAPKAGRARSGTRRVWLGGGVAALVLVGIGIATGVLPITATQVADAAGYLLLAVTVVFFGWLFFAATGRRVERKRLYLIGVFFLAAALFWSVFEQAGSTLNLFADRSTQQRRSSAGVSRAAGSSRSTRSSSSSLAPVFAWLWLTLGTRRAVEPDQVRARPDRRRRSASSC